jgi:anaerobic selenocysteine-containing dehydrogenase
MAVPEPELWVAPAYAERRGIANGDAIRIASARGAMAARARVTARIREGTVWMRDGWDGLNRLSSGEAVLPDGAVEIVGFSGGQAAFDARVDIAPIERSSS